MWSALKRNCRQEGRRSWRVFFWHTSSFSSSSSPFPLRTLRSPRCCLSGLFLCCCHLGGDFTACSCCVSAHRLRNVFCVPSSKRILGGGRGPSSQGSLFFFSHFIPLTRVCCESWGFLDALGGRCLDWKGWL